jgi:hypothetical protein
MLCHDLARVGDTGKKYGIFVENFFKGGQLEDWNGL